MCVLKKKCFRGEKSLDCKLALFQDQKDCSKKEVKTRKYKQAKKRLQKVKIRER